MKVLVEDEQKQERLNEILERDDEIYIQQAIMKQMNGFNRAMPVDVRPAAEKKNQKDSKPKQSEPKTMPVFTMGGPSKD